MSFISMFLISLVALVPLYIFSLEILFYERSSSSAAEHRGHEDLPRVNQSSQSLACRKQRRVDRQYRRAGQQKYSRASPCISNIFRGFQSDQPSPLII